MYEPHLRNALAGPWGHGTVQHVVPILVVVGDMTGIRVNLNRPLVSVMRPDQGHVRAVRVPKAEVAQLQEPGFSGGRDPNDMQGRVGATKKGMQER